MTAPRSHRTLATLGIAMALLAGWSAAGASTYVPLRGWNFSVSPARTDVSTITDTDGDGDADWVSTFNFGGQPGDFKLIVQKTTVVSGFVPEAGQPMEMRIFAEFVTLPGATDWALEWVVERDDPVARIGLYAYSGTEADGRITLSDWAAGDFLGEVDLSAQRYDVTGAVNGAAGAGRPYIGFVFREIEDPAYGFNGPGKIFDTPSGFPNGMHLVTTSAVPAPAGLWLLGTGVAVLCARSWRRRGRP